MDSSHYAQAGAQPSFVSEVPMIISHDTHPMKVSGENVTLQPMRGELIKLAKAVRPQNSSCANSSYGLSCSSSWWNASLKNFCKQ
jgi:hypothetical protein